MPSRNPSTGRPRRGAGPNPTSSIEPAGRIEAAFAAECAAVQDLLDRNGAPSGDDYARLWVERFGEFDIFDGTVVPGSAVAEVRGWLAAGVTDPDTAFAYNVFNDMGGAPEDADEVTRAGYEAYRSRVAEGGAS